MVDSRALNFLANQTFVAEIRVGRALEIVRATLGHGVDIGPGEAALAHVVGGQAHLNLLDGVERYELRVRLAARGGRVEPERVVEDGAVKREVVMERVATTETLAAGPGCEACKIFLRAADSGQRADGCRADISDGPRAVGIDLAVAVGSHHHFAKLLSVALTQGHARLIRFAQHQLNVIFDERFVAHKRDFDLIAPPNPQVRQIEYPLSRVAIPYVVPVGRCTASTVAPGSA